MGENNFLDNAVRYLGTSRGPMLSPAEQKARAARDGFAVDEYGRRTGTRTDIELPSVEALKKKVK